MVKARRVQATKPDKYLWVIAHNEFMELEPQLNIQPDPEAHTSIAEGIVRIRYEGMEQEIDDLADKLQTEPFKSQVLKIVDKYGTVYDASTPTLFGLPIHQGIRRRQCIRILREISRINPTAEHAEEVYHWASLLTAESRYTENEEEYEDYYLTDAGQRLLFKLKHIPAGEIVGLVGLQGVGKTSMLKKMAHDLDTKETHVFFIHWTPDWYEKLKQNPEIQQTYREQIREAMYEKMFTYGSQQRRMAALGGRIPNRDTDEYIRSGRMAFETMEQALTKAECRMAMEKAMNLTLPYVRYLFIDLPDYDRRAMSTRNEDLQSIEAIWKRAIETAGSEMNATIVLGIQKETFGGHFFYGKMHIEELKPMTREQMIEAYKHKWKTTEPFTEEALGLLADFSRGIFRRFLRYIAKSVETACTRKEFPITASAVNASVTLETLFEDMNQEMAKIFKGNEEQKRQAVMILTKLKQNQGQNRKQLAEALEISEDATGTILKKLELYGYVRRERGGGNEWKWYQT